MFIGNRMPLDAHKTYLQKKNLFFFCWSRACLPIQTSRRWCVYVKMEKPLTDLGLGHHCGLSVAERRERQAELWFFVPLEIQQLPQSKTSLVFVSHNPDTQLDWLTLINTPPYAHTSTNRLWICLAPAPSAFGPQMCFIFSSDLSQTDEMWSREAMFFGEAIYLRFISPETKAWWKQPK